MPPEFWILSSFLPMHPGYHTSTAYIFPSDYHPHVDRFSLFPIFNPFSPANAANMWCYCRSVYMPMSYIYGKRFVGPITPLILQLREELYDQPYHEINWKGVRHRCAKVSLTTPN